MSDIIITPASGKIDFYQDLGAASLAKIELTSTNDLALSTTSGNLIIGDASRDIYIGNGINDVDIIFEQNGEIRPLPAKTLNIGTSGSFTQILASKVNINQNSFTNIPLDVYSSTSGATILNVAGTKGALFSVTDNLSGSLMSVNNDAGLPVFEVFSDDRIVGGRFGQNDFVMTSGGNVGIGTGSPVSKLQVSGLVTANSGNFTNSLTVNNNTVWHSGNFDSSNIVRTTGDKTISGNIIFDQINGASLTLTVSGLNRDQAGIYINDYTGVDPEYTFAVNGSGEIYTGQWSASTIGVNKGGTGRSSYSNGQLLIGSGTSLAANTLTAGTGIGITNGSGTITIGVTGIPSSSITNFNSSVSGLLPTIANSGDNRVLTSTGGSVGVNAESNLTFNGNLLSVTGSGSFSNNITASGFVRSGGTSSQFLKADGSVDSSTYLTSLSHNHGIANSAGTQQFTFGVNDNVRIAGGGSTSISFDSGTKQVTVSSTDTNTTYSAGSGLSLTGTTFNHTDTSSQGSVDNTNGTVIQDVTLDTYGHVTALNSIDLDGRYYTETEVDTALSAKLNTSLKGANNGLAELDATGKVPSSQLPSYVDDVLEYAAIANFPATGETGKIYVATGTNLTYRWSGSAYVEISSSLALGETSSTAYRGDRGKTAYDHSQVTTGSVHGSSTVGSALFRISDNNTSNKFVRVNTDNTLAYRTGAEVLSDIGAYASSNPNGYTTNVGTVTSVAGSGSVAGLTLTGTVTTNGSLTLGGTLSVPESAIANDAVTNAKAANMAVNTIKGRITAGTGDPEDLTAANVRTIINVADGANNYAHPTDGGAGNTITAANLRVLSAITVNTLGHVTSVSSKDLTTNDIPTLNQNTTGTSAGVLRTVTGTNSAELVRCNMADNDFFRILAGGTATNAGYAEIATADDGTEPIYVRQYTGTFTTLTRTATLLDNSGDTSFPGSVTANSFVKSGGTASQFLKANGTVDSTTYAATNQTMFIGTTSVAINRGSAALVLTGITSIDGNAGTVTSGVYTNRSITINGTTNQITSSAGAQDLSANRTWTLSLPQDIHSSATPTFGGLTSNGTVNIRSASTSSTATQIPVFIADPSSATRAIVTRTPAQLLSDIGAAATITGGASTIASSNLTINRALVSDGSGKVAVSDITNTELNYLDNVSSNIQTQLNGKQATLTNPVTGTGASNHIAYWSSSSSIAHDSNQLVWDSTNNRLGIGATSPSVSLEVGGSIRQSWIGTDLQLATIYDNSYRMGINYFANQRIMNLFSTSNDGGGAITFSTRGLGAGSSATDYGTERMRIDGSGNIGIGTTSPTSRLQVSGLITANSGTFGNVMISGNMVSATNVNGNLIIKPNGNGALQADDAGNSRGTGSVDLQRSRTSVSGVAHGDYSVIGGGLNNRSAGASSTIGGGSSNNSGGQFSTVGGGTSNSAAGYRSTIGGGSNNSSSAYYQDSTIGGGYDNSVIGRFSTIGGGYNNSTGGGYYGGSTVGGGRDNSASHSYSTIGGGRNNVAGGYYSTVGGGYGNNISNTRATIGGGIGNSAGGYASTVGGGQVNAAVANLSTVPGGIQAKATRHGEFSHSAGRFGNQGDAQHTILIARNVTTNATATVLFLDGSVSSLRLTIPAETTWIFTIKLSAYNDTDNLSAGYNIRGCIRRNAASGTSIIGSNIVESWSEGAMSGCVATATADDTNEALQINVTGLASKSIRWVAVVDISQVSYAAP